MPYGWLLTWKTWKIQGMQSGQESGEESGKVRETIISFLVSVLWQTKKRTGVVAKRN